MSRRWKEITFRLRQVILGIYLFTSFSYNGLTDFLIQVEYEVDYLGEDSKERWNHADKFIYDMPIQLGEDQDLPISLTE